MSKLNFREVDSKQVFQSKTVAKTFWQLVASFALLGGVLTQGFAEDATNVTSVVTAAVKNNKLTINADNATFGDTAPGVTKKLTVEYRIGNENLKKEVGESGRLEIVVPAGQKLVITKAVMDLPMDRHHRPM